LAAPAAQMRKEIPEIGWGRFTIVDVGDEAILAIRYAWRSNSVLFLHNLCKGARGLSS
jgi:maltose alpha-D-glucosyltransferase / alpha-amylase